MNKLLTSPCVRTDTKVMKLRKAKSATPKNLIFTYLTFVYLSKIFIVIGADNKIAKQKKKISISKLIISAIVAPEVIFSTGNRFSRKSEAAHKAKRPPVAKEKILLKLSRPWNFDNKFSVFFSVFIK